MKMIMKPEILGKGNTSFKLMNFDLANHKKLLSIELIKLSNAAKESLKSIYLSNNKKCKLRKDCK